MSQIIIGLTGGVASGKSELARRFEALGVFVADADVIAREVVAPGRPALVQIVAAFGPTMLHADGGLDRRAMRERVFADAGARRQLESIMHPPIRIALHAACAAARGVYAMAAIPLLAEGGGRAAYPWLR
ncbi:MAG: dephospho-CoA kinase, partial [Luteimonas sp.]